MQDSENVVAGLVIYETDWGGFENEVLETHPVNMVDFRISLGDLSCRVEDLGSDYWRFAS